MFAGIKRFVCRHRRKLLIGSVVVGGVVFATHYAQRKLREWQEREMKEFLERTQRQQHFEKNERTCNQTILTLSPNLCDVIGGLFDTDAVLEKLRSGAHDKLALWEDLKILAFTRVSVLLYCGTLFVILMRVQVNLIGGYLYHQSTCDSDNCCDIDNKCQEDYLKLCEYFLTKGVRDLCSLIETKVRFILEGESLKKQLTIQDIEHYFWAIQSAITSDPEDPLSHLSRYILPPVYVDGIRGRKGTVMYNLVTDTVEIVETNEIKLLATSCINHGFTQIVDRVSEFYVPASVSDLSTVESTSSGSSKLVTLPNGFTDLKKVTIPMAKIVPIVNGLSNSAKASGSTSDAYQHWIKQFINMSNLKMLGANIYESYSNHCSS